MQSSHASEGQRREEQPSATPDHPDAEGAPGGTHEDDRRASPTPEERLALEAERERLEDRYRRALADLENYRKRSARETERRVAEARERLLGEWLEALDSVERVLRMQPDDEGLRAVLEQMDAILARHGVTRLGAPGERFGPSHSPRPSPSSLQTSRPTTQFARSPARGSRSTTAGYCARRK